MKALERRLARIEAEEEPVVTYKTYRYRSRQVLTGSVTQSRLNHPHRLNARLDQAWIGWASR